MQQCFRTNIILLKLRNAALFSFDCSVYAASARGLWFSFPVISGQRLWRPLFVCVISFVSMKLGASALALVLCFSNKRLGAMLLKSKIKTRIKLLFHTTVLVGTI
jgi:hypothetical protein